MKNRRNYYRILHVQPDAPAHIIKSSYRTLMQKLKMHPDLGGDQWNASVLNEAYQVLSDEDKRAAYDATFLGGSDRLQQAGRQSEKSRNQTADEPAAQAKPNVDDPSLCAFCSTPKTSPGYTEDLFCRRCDAPTARVTIVRSTDAGGRTCMRMPYNAPLELFLSVDAGARVARLRDLSPAGMRIQTRFPVDSGMIVRIDSRMTAAVGRVVFCNRAAGGSGFHSGIEFITAHFHNCQGTFFSEQA